MKGNGRPGWLDPLSATESKSPRLQQNSQGPLGEGVTSEWRGVRSREGLRAGRKRARRSLKSTSLTSTEAPVALQKRESDQEPHV